MRFWVSITITIVLLIVIGRNVVFLCMKLQKGAYKKIKTS